MAVRAANGSSHQKTKSHFFFAEIIFKLNIEGVTQKINLRRTTLFACRGLCCLLNVSAGIEF